MFELKKDIRVLPIHVINSRVDSASALNVGEELESLISTLGGKIVDRIIQKLDRPNPATYIGTGKVSEVQEKILEKKVDLVVLNTMVKPGQVYALKKKLEETNPNIEVWDRVDLILSIFEKHASTSEAKLQIELAKMNYMGPRIYGMGMVLSRQGGGIGTSGVGETNTELMKRHWRQEKKNVIDKLKKISKNREQQLEHRVRSGFKTISIVGYTNSGKSSLFNLLSGKKKLVKNVLFATLDSSIGKVYIEGLHSDVLITDTIGFIRDLPPLLISAFKSTLMESIHADILLGVVDASDIEVDIKIYLVDQILKELGIDMNKVVYVFNKIDSITPLQIKNLQEKYATRNPIFISVKNEEGIGEIIKRIKNSLLPTINIS